MHNLYNFVTGPLVWVSFTIFIGGSLYRLISLFISIHKKEKFIFSYMSWRYSLRSIFHWIIPFATENWKRHPVLTIATFTFHICLFFTPIFLIAHNVLFEEAWDISFWTLSDSSADFMTFLVIFTCIFFLIRRIVSPEVKFVTSASDYIILAIVSAPFITGFIAYHQWFNYDIFLILHIVAGEIMLITIPFSRLSHMLFSPFTRAYMGSEFGGVRHSKDW